MMKPFDVTVVVQVSADSQSDALAAVETAITRNMEDRAKRYPVVLESEVKQSKRNPR